MSHGTIRSESRLASPAQYRGLPAICRSCGTIFPSAIGAPVQGSNLVLQFSGMSFGPCPNCFAFAGKMPAESIDLSRPDVIAALQAPATLPNLRKLVSVLAAASHEDWRVLQIALANSQGRTADEVATEVERRIPGLHLVADWIRDRDNRVELATWLQVILAVLAILLTLQSSQQGGTSQQGVTPSQIEQIVHALAPDLSAQPHSEKRLGRNEPCHCGSGKKYKRCHGAPSGLPTPANP